MSDARTITDSEFTQIALDMVRLHKLDASKYNFLEGLENKDLLKDAAIALEGRTILITDNYQSDCPSYNGKTGVIFWGEVCFVSLLIEVDGKMQIMEDDCIEVFGGKPTYKK